jgi:hypothetical protein
MQTRRELKMKKDKSIERLDKVLIDLDDALNKVTLKSLVANDEIQGRLAEISRLIQDFLSMLKPQKRSLIL